jgi:hypothetical protein
MVSKEGRGKDKAMMVLFIIQQYVTGWGRMKRASKKFV